MPRRHDVLSHWADRGVIDAAQLEAGRRFERLFTRATIEGLAAADLCRPKVDARSGRQHCRADVAIAANEELAALRQVLGEIDFALVSRVIGAGQDLTEDAASDAERRYLAHRIRDALGMMATVEA